MERFKRIIQREIEDFKRAFEPLPIYEELRDNFPHKTSCTQAMPLREEEREDFIRNPVVGTWTPRILGVVQRTYLVCDECGVMREFEEEDKGAGGGGEIEKSNSTGDARVLRRPATAPAPA